MVFDDFLYVPAVIGRIADLNAELVEMIWEARASPHLTPLFVSVRECRVGGCDLLLGLAGESSQGPSASTPPTPFRASRHRRGPTLSRLG